MRNTRHMLWMRRLAMTWTMLGIVLSAPVTASQIDPAAAWRDYRQTETMRQPAVEFPYQHCFQRAATAYDLPVSLLLAVARGESNFDPSAVSSANAHGLMQILWPGTARHLGFTRLAELHDPCANVDAGARYLVELLQRYDGDMHLTLAAYNYGPGRIPVDGSQVPNGARWYSSYIYRHLRYVLGDSLPQALPKDWQGDGELELAIFAAPYRAQAFVESLQLTAPALRLDWFREDTARHRVVLLYATREEHDVALKLLSAAGFPMDVRS
ncbi:MAG: lytic transglycosylase domain-containing protein [Gammaproteobacteria bacterium]